MKLTSPMHLQSVLSQGWTAWTLLLLLMTAVMSARGAFAEFAFPPGAVALGIVSALVTLQALMSVLVHVLDARWVRRANAGLAGLVTLVIAAHHVHSTMGGATNGICGTASQGIVHAVETAHHGLGILMCVLAMRWIGQRGDAPAAFGDRLASD